MTTGCALCVLSGPACVTCQYSWSPPTRTSTSMCVGACVQLSRSMHNRYRNIPWHCYVPASYYFLCCTAVFWHLLCSNQHCSNLWCFFALLPSPAAFWHSSLLCCSLHCCLPLPPSDTPSVQINMATPVVLLPALLPSPAAFWHPLCSIQHGDTCCAAPCIVNFLLHAALPPLVTFSFQVSNAAIVVLFPALYPEPWT